MTKFESKVVAIPYSQQRVFDTLSDLSNLEKVRGMLPEDKVRDLKVSTDAVSLSASIQVAPMPRPREVNI